MVKQIYLYLSSSYETPIFGDGDAAQRPRRPMRRHKVRLLTRFRIINHHDASRNVDASARRRVARSQSVAVRRRQPNNLPQNQLRRSKEINVTPETTSVNDVPNQFFILCSELIFSRAKRGVGFRAEELPWKSCLVS